MADLVVQRFATPPEPGLRRLYYRVRGGSARPRQRGQVLVLAGGTVLGSDTYFNGFFEDYWRCFAPPGRLELRARLEGAGRLQIFRKTKGAKGQLLARAEFDGGPRVLRLPVADPGPAAGLLSIELLARSERLILHAADWVACDVRPRPVRLVVGYATFDREPDLLGNLNVLLRDAALREVLTKVVVADQGTRPLRNHAGYAELAARAGRRLSVVEQANHGGAGGFARCIFEACDDPAATHVLLTDDDARVEAESVRRAAMFLALARSDLAVGGGLLDRNRPGELVEVGTAYDPRRVAVAPATRLRVDEAGSVQGLTRARGNACGGWWFFAFPLDIVWRVGMPMPLFLRGDDVEFGCRLSRAGVPTVPLPGVAVRHEALDRARRGWQTYYDVRNMLAVGAVHFSLSRRDVARRFLGGVLGELLAYRYDQAWLLCEAVVAYLAGPAALARYGPTDHDRLLSAWKCMTPDRIADRAAPPAPHAVSRPRRLARLLLAARLVLRNLVFTDPAPSAVPERVLEQDRCDWYAVGTVDVVTVDQADGCRVVLRRARGNFVRLLSRALWLTLRLMAGHRRVARAWRGGAAELTTRQYWRSRSGVALPSGLARPAGAGASVPVPPAERRGCAIVAMD